MHNHDSADPKNHWEPRHPILAILAVITPIAMFPNVIGLAIGVAGASLIAAIE